MIPNPFDLYRGYRRKRLYRRAIHDLAYTRLLRETGMGWAFIRMILRRPDAVQ